jgi:hypothetical protein
MPDRTSAKSSPRATSSRTKRSAAATSTKKSLEHVLDALPDVLDFRDRMFEPTLVQVPREQPLERYRALSVPVLDQGSEGACTGFALATVAHHLLLTTHADPLEVSPWMVYRMAQRYDEWPGERYSGSSARGAMKAWHKHGLCGVKLWKKSRKRLDATITEDATLRPLGAYLRVNHRDLVAMHAALAEVGVLLATARVHTGWGRVGRDGVIPFHEGEIGAHAFAIVGYDAHGFWIQNSWGKDWGKDGFCRVSYDDWLMNGSDVWVARLGVPIRLRATHVNSSLSQGTVILRTGEPSFDRLRPHIVSLGNDGELRTSGTFGTTLEDVRELIEHDLPRITSKWEAPRVVLYAHGGLVSEKAAIQRTSEYLDTLLAAEVYPISFIWKTDYWTTLSNMLKDVVERRRPEGVLDGAKDFMLDRLDDALEPLARALTGRAQWREMKENALRASTRRQGGARVTARVLAELRPEVELHLVAHSAGSILLAPLVEYLTASGVIANGPMKGTQGLGRTIASCSLWAPACTTELFHAAYAPAIRSRRIERFGLYTLTDAAERDDHCARIYNKSLLYLVSHAFEDRARVPIIRPHGTPILGMAACVQRDPDLKQLLRLAHVEHILAPNSAGDDEGRKSTQGSGATSHGGFDDDRATILGTLTRMLGSRPGATRKTKGSARGGDMPKPELCFRTSPEKRASIRGALPD